MFQQVERFVALACLVIVFLTCLCIACVELLQGLPINQLVQDTLSAGVIVAAHLVGVEVGRGLASGNGSGVK